MNSSPDLNDAQTEETKHILRVLFWKISSQIHT